jgi:hypothetical protein
VLHLPHSLSQPPSVQKQAPDVAPLFSLQRGEAESSPTSKSFDWHLIQQLLENSRVNINIRQVEP